MNVNKSLKVYAFDKNYNNSIKIFNIAFNPMAKIEDKTCNLKIYVAYICIENP